MTIPTRILLTRHGESTFNAQSRVQGRSDEAALTERGRLMAVNTGQLLQGVGVDHIYTSPLRRALETAQLLDLPGVPITPTEQLLEIDLPEWEGLTHEQVRTQFPQDYQHWRNAPAQFVMAGRYPLLELLHQAAQFWQDVIPRHRGQTLMVVGHATINRMLLVQLLGLDPADYFRLQQSNCGLTVLNLQPERVQWEALNLVFHTGNLFPKSLFPKYKGGTRIYLVRHGETDWNRNGQFQGQRDIPLNENGITQAEKTQKLLSSVVLDFAVSSPLSRSQQTAEIILASHPKIKLNLIPDLQEISHGLWEGKFHREVETEFPGMLDIWNQNPERVQMPGGENLTQVWERAGQTWQKIITQYDGQQGIVVAHDAINKAILCQLFHLAPAHFWLFKQGNGAVSVIDYPEGAGGSPILQTLNLTRTDGLLDQTVAGAL
ncbi:phosphoglycerate mutase [Gloeomargarita lithophora Alchichica-D10]|uniref:Phosphoglycerate mutase n=1 Tax=Gloeomargarita lithophora Alchichica-D10 TaxID=1188229 RepID=A0A1J0AEY1_9CYAN|nr:histidine phosphatase family protein [Gloeomargarita lithophora]APB34502.1 phosphoglycerate mutase [Gloeomargarita lithophora Alchichica-D10]